MHEKRAMKWPSAVEDRYRVEDEEEQDDDDGGGAGRDELRRTNAAGETPYAAVRRSQPREAVRETHPPTTTRYPREAARDPAAATSEPNMSELIGTSRSVFSHASRAASLRCGRCAEHFRSCRYARAGAC